MITAQCWEEEFVSYFEQRGHMEDVYDIEMVEIEFNRYFTYTL